MTTKKTDTSDPLTDTGKQRRAIAAKNAMSMAYLKAIVWIFFASMAGAGLFLYLRPASDPLLVVPVSLALAGTTIFSLLGFIRAQATIEKTEIIEAKVEKNTQITKDTHSALDGRFEELMEFVKKGEWNDGYKAGVDAAQKRTDQLAVERVEEKAAEKTVGK